VEKQKQIHSIVLVKNTTVNSLKIWQCRLPNRKWTTCWLGISHSRRYWCGLAKLGDNLCLWWTSVYL